MGKSLEEVQLIKRKFREVVFMEPFDKYVAGTHLSDVGTEDEKAPADQKDDFCILVLLERPLPPHLSLPNEYEGVRVFVRVSGRVVEG